MKVADRMGTKECGECREKECGGGGERVKEAGNREPLSTMAKSRIWRSSKMDG